MARKLSVLIFGLLLLSVAGAGRLYGQVTAQIVGTVMDAQQNAIVGAKVTVTSLATSIQYKATTNASGAYTVTFLQPGSYRVDVDAPGFQRMSRTGVLLEVAQTATVNLVLKVGATMETVTVSDEAPLLDVSTAAIGGLVKPEQVENLPMLGRNSNALMVLEPGVVATAATTRSPVLESHYQFFSINGSRPNQSQFLLDGGNDTNLAFNGPEYTPQVEEVQEYRIQTSDFSAAYGNSAGGVINIASKAGTNDFHGSLFEYGRNDIFSANDFFSNRAGNPRPKLRYNQFGGAFGGPIVRKRAFFFFAYEGLRQITPAVATSSVPTDLQRAGDFSQTFTSTGQLIKIYDPLSTVPDPNNPGQYIRTQFPGNKIPQNRLNPVALAIQKYYPEPNQAGNSGTGLNNYFFSGSNTQQVNNYSGRGDYHMSDATQLMGRFSIEELNPWITPGLFGPGNITSYNYATKPQHHPYAIGKLIHTFSPTFFGDFHGSWAAWDYHSVGLSNGFDPTQLGFPAYVTANAASLGFPQITQSEMANLGGYFNDHSGSARYEFATNFTKAFSKQTLQFGFQYGVGTYITFGSDHAAGQYTFNKGFTQGPNPLVTTANGGFGYVSFLLGDMAGGVENGTSLRNNAEYTQPYWGLYGEDSIKITPNLAVNLGLRWDVELPRTEQHNRMANFDFTNTATLSNGATVKGGLAFPGVNGLSSGEWQSNNHNFAPRLGVTYALGKSTVVRSGFGLFYANSWGNGRNNNSMPQDGFFCQTQSTASLDGGLTPYATLSDPFPNGFCPATGSPQGLVTNLGSAVNFIDRNYRTPYMEEWSLDVQRALPGNMVVQVTYSGSHGVKLGAVREWNQLETKYLALGAQLNSKVANPFYGAIASGPLATPTITLGQSLRPYPQFTGVSSRLATFGGSSYNAMYVTFQKRTSHGLTLSASYTWSKLFDDVQGSSNYGGFANSGFYNAGTQNYYDMRGERSRSSFDIPQTLVVSYIYELPFGPGKAFLNGNRILGTIVGGWQINGLTTFQAGVPVQVTGGNNSGSFSGTQRPNWSGKKTSLGGAIGDRLTKYFDTSQFSANAPFTFGNSPRSMPDVRTPGVDNWDMSLFKGATIHEKLQLQFRAEAFNTFNRVQFGNPNSTFNTPAFGVISSQQNNPRTLQLGLRMVF